MHSLLASANSLNLSGSTLLQRQEWVSALRCFHRALAIVKEVADEHQVASGNVQENRTPKSPALRYFDRGDLVTIVGEDYKFLLFGSPVTLDQRTECGGDNATGSYLISLMTYVLTYNLALTYQLWAAHSLTHQRLRRRMHKSLSLYRLAVELHHVEDGIKITTTTQSVGLLSNMVHACLALGLVNDAGFYSRRLLVHRDGFGTPDNEEDVILLRIFQFLSSLTPELLGEDDNLIAPAA